MSETEEDESYVGWSLLGGCCLPKATTTLVQALFLKVRSHFEAREGRRASCQFEVEAVCWRVMQRATDAATSRRTLANFFAPLTETHKLLCESTQFDGAPQ